MTDQPKLDRRTATTMREVTKTVQLQQRHLVFWTLIVLFTVGLFFFVRHATSLFASTPQIDEGTSSGGPSLHVEVAIDEQGLATVNGVPSNKIFQPLSQFDEFKYKLIDKPKSFIDQLTVRVKFANQIPEGTKIQSFAVHGIDAATSKQIDANTIEYTATGIGPDAVYTIAAELPPGSIDWPWWRHFIALVNGLPIGFWIILSAALPGLTALVLLFMFWPNLQNLWTKPSGPVTTPPTNIPAGLVGVIVHGRISPREIAATIIDLANRGYLTIYNKGNGTFSFAKRRAWQNLRPYELQLLMSLFNASPYKTTKRDIELSVGKNLFSPEIARVYVDMYDAATELGYFRRNPGQIHRLYRMIGLFLFFTGLGAFVSALLVELHPTYLLLFFAGMMTMALVVTVLADDVPLLTPAGRKARAEWLAFQHYMTDDEPVGYEEGAQTYYEKFLPYAIVLGVEVPWVHRFRKHPFGLPYWYDSIDATIPIESFAQGLYPIVGGIAALFAAVKEPTVQ